MVFQIFWKLFSKRDEVRGCVLEFEKQTQADISLRYKELVIWRFGAWLKYPVTFFIVDPKHPPKVQLPSNQLFSGITVVILAAV